MVSKKFYVNQNYPIITAPSAVTIAPNGSYILTLTANVHSDCHKDQADINFISNFTPSTTSSTPGSTRYNVQIDVQRDGTSIINGKQNLIQILIVSPLSVSPVFKVIDTNVKKGCHTYTITLFNSDPTYNLEVDYYCFSVYS